MPVPAGERHQRGGDKRRKPAADHARHLISHARAAVTVACAKQLGKHRLLHADHHIVSDVRKHDREEDNPEDRLCLQRHKERPGAECADQRPGDIHPSTAKAIRQPGEAGDGQAADPARFFALLLLKLSRLFHAVTDPQGHHDQHNAEDKRNTPAPAQELLVCRELTY